MSIPIVRPSNVWGPLYRSGRQRQQAMVENSVSGRPTDLSEVYGEANGLMFTSGIVPGRLTWCTLPRLLKTVSITSLTVNPTV